MATAAVAGGLRGWRGHLHVLCGEWGWKGLVGVDTQSNLASGLTTGKTQLAGLLLQAQSGPDPPSGGPRILPRLPQGRSPARRVLPLSGDLPLRAGAGSSCWPSQGEAPSLGLAMPQASALFWRLTKDPGALQTPFRNRQGAWVLGTLTATCLSRCTPLVPGLRGWCGNEAEPAFN